MSGLSAVVGYGVGSAISALVRQFVRAEPRPDYKRIAWIALAVAAVFGSILLMWLSHRWQNELRALIGIDDEPGFSGWDVQRPRRHQGWESLLPTGARCHRWRDFLPLRQMRDHN